MTIINRKSHSNKGLHLTAQILVYLTISCASSMTYAEQAEQFVGEVIGYDGDMSEVSVVLENRTVFLTTSPDQSGGFSFENLEKGQYFVKVTAPGYQTSPAKPILLPSVDNETAFELRQLTSDDFIFHWEEDQTASGLEYSSQIAEPIKITFLDEPVEVADTRASGHLMSQFNVVLADTDAKWTTDHAYRLLQTLSTLMDTLEPTEPSDSRTLSQWTLSQSELENDIEITRYDDGRASVAIAVAAFANATPKTVEVEGRKGIWFSQRLHHAITRYVTDHGRDREQVNRILYDRYGVKTDPNYDYLTANTTGETRYAFQDFKPEEFIAIINMFEEMPKGFHKIPELKHIVRRLDGTPHPIYPTAPAVAWPSVGYIEFMEIAFKNTATSYIHRLVLHEKAHFIWEHLLDKQTIADWIELGEWFEDPDAKSGWSTHQTTQFVSAYAHLKNPNEDMAESIADFVVNPDILRSRAPLKYDFIRDRIMQGSIYISKIREDLTFEVFNLYPDYEYPGKVKSVDIRVKGGPDEDKTVQIELQLHELDNEDTGATEVYLKVVSDVGTYKIMFLYPINENRDYIEEGTVFFGELEFPSSAKAGFWYVEHIHLKDKAGNRRYQRDNTFDFKLYVNNRLEDYYAPEYAEYSAFMEVYDTTKVVFDETRNLQIIKASWEFEENRAINYLFECQAIINLDGVAIGSRHEYGYHTDEMCHVEFPMPHYMRGGTYSLRYIGMKDAAGNYNDVSFLDDGPETVRTVHLVTDNPDTQAPELDVNRIFVNANPTNPDDPNGETLVEITFYVREDNAGLYDISFILRDPLGGIHDKHHEVPNRNDLYSRHPRNEWIEFTTIWHLPVGSPPGIWGIQEILVPDKAGNTNSYKFDEIVHVEVLNLTHATLIF